MALPFGLRAAVPFHLGLVDGLRCRQDRQHDHCLLDDPVNVSFDPTAGQGQLANLFSEAIKGLLTEVALPNRSVKRFVDLGQSRHLRWPRQSCDPRTRWFVLVAT